MTAFHLRQTSSSSSTQSTQNCPRYGQAPPMLEHWLDCHGTRPQARLGIFATTEALPLSTLSAFPGRSVVHYDGLVRRPTAAAAAWGDVVLVARITPSPATQSLVPSSSQLISQYTIYRCDLMFCLVHVWTCLQCFDTVGWASGRASSP